jgi:hypothetical protein
MKIKHKSNFATVEDSEKPTLYCPFCKKWDIDAVLGERPDYDLSDKEFWRQCTNCKRLITLHQGMQQRGFTTVIEPVEHPSLKELERISGIDNKLPKQHSEMQRLKEDIEKEKDPDIKLELRRGNKVIIVSEDSVAKEVYD